MQAAPDSLWTEGSSCLGTTSGKGPRRGCSGHSSDTELSSEQEERSRWVSSVVGCFSSCSRREAMVEAREARCQELSGRRRGRSS